MIFFFQMPVITADEMGKAKAGFAIRLANDESAEDASLPEELFEHNRAALEFFLSIQEASDKLMDSCLFPLPFPALYLLTHVH